MGLVIEVLVMGLVEERAALALLVMTGIVLAALAALAVRTSSAYVGEGGRS